jgi:hypothetical protein
LISEKKAEIMALKAQADELLIKGMQEKMTDYKIEQSKPEAICRGSYHGCNCNGVCCRRLVGNANLLLKKQRKY